ncbi:putative pilus biosynthesis protein HicB [Paenibacillus sp. 598K]|nr:putative pilus biosynthesis protein HicB [Paenibacillus sp. 598K]
MTSIALRQRNKSALEGDNLEEALSMAQEALALHLYGVERDSDVHSKSIKPVHEPDTITTPRKARS